MPINMSGHTQMPAYGIAERAAEFIIADAGGPGGTSSSSGKPSLIDKAKNALGVGGK
jgi:hypothetical protein